MTNSLDLARHDRSLMSPDGKRAVMAVHDNGWACFTGYVEGRRFHGTSHGVVDSFDKARDFLDGALSPAAVTLGTRG